MSNLLSRELDVLGNGLVDGAISAGSESWNALQDEAYAFTQAPVKTTVEYLQNHAGDFAAGAGIAMMVPKGTATKVLTLWSLRGVGACTFDAAMSAADPNCDVEQTRLRFSTGISHEATAFAASLPMGIAGGMAGRATANAFLGKGNVVPDLFTGKVTMVDVKRNVATLGDSVAPSRPKVLLTDLDDTLFPLQEYLISTLQKNGEMLGKRMGMTDIEALRMLGPERLHPWILEESALARKFDGTPAQFTEQVVKPFWKNDAEALAGVKAFPHVAETLQAARERGLKVVVQTNAPLPWAIKRLHQVGLDGYVDHLYCIETPKPALSRVLSPEALDHGQLLLDSAVGTPHKIGQITTLPAEFRKPSLGGYETVMKDLGLKPRDVIAVGDNLHGDGAAPRNLGIPFVWAEYGHRIRPELSGFMDKVRERPDHVTVTPPTVKVDSLASRPIAAIESYADLLPLLNRKPSLRLLFEQVRPDINVRSVLLPTTGYNVIPKFLFGAKESYDNHGSSRRIR